MRRSSCHDPHHVVHPRSSNRIHETDRLGTMAYFRSQQPDAGSSHTYDTHSLFLATKKTGSTTPDPYALYYGHYLDFPSDKSTIISCTREYALAWHHPHYAGAHYLDDY